METRRLSPAIPEADLERIMAPLEALEAAFRPLLQPLPIDTEPAFVVLCAPEDPE